MSWPKQVPVNTLEKNAKVWNETMRRLGYTEVFYEGEG